MKKTFLYLAVIAFVFSCKKEEIVTTETPAVSHEEVLNQLALNINTATYSDLASKATTFQTTIQNFVTNPSAASLEQCRSEWKLTRSSWEKSEGFLYGPVSTDNIDPRIDTWPVDFTAINTLLLGASDFTDPNTVTSLDDALKGFHPIEFMLWGQNGTKVYTDFTSREKEYLIALTLDLKSLVLSLSSNWETSNGNSFYSKFKTPSNTNPFYSNYKSVYEEMINALIGICDEVANGKINEPLVSQDASLEESPYAKNSMRDFTNNIESVENVYLGKYATDGLGIEDVVRKYNLSLDNTIKNKIAVAKNALAAITLPFGEAIFQQPTQVQNAVDAINDLKATLENDLLPLIQSKITN